MARNEHKRQQKLIKKKRRTNDIKKERNKKLNVSNRELILAAERAPWVGCYVSGADGMYVIYAIRQTRGGTVASVFLIDMYCLGVKDARFIKDFDLEAFRDNHIDRDGDKVAPAVALKRIEEAIAYARSIGFEPHSQTEICKHIFGNLDISECTDKFEFGKNGRPLYTSGPRDSREKQTRILSTLEKLGPGNFDFVLSQETIGNEYDSYLSDDLDEEEYEYVDDDSDELDENTVDAVETRFVE